MYLKVLNESAADRPPPEASMSDLGREVRRHVAAALAGNARAREMMLDRIFGKAPV
jgi:hypothetical protein